MSAPDDRSDGGAAAAGGLEPERWVERHGDVLYRFALARVGDREGAEEVVQETFVSALRNQGTFEGRASERTWLVGILRRKIVDRYRAEKRERAMGAGGAEDFFDEKGIWKALPAKWPADPASFSDREGAREDLEDCLERLSENLADAILLREVAGLDSDAVCQVLDLTPTNLWTRLHRARMLLRRCLESKWFGRGGKPTGEAR